MDIRKWHDKYSIDVELKYNSNATRENYKSQVLCFLNKFKDEVEPKSIDNEKIKLWLLDAKTINSRKHRLCALNSFYKITVGMPCKIQKLAGHSNVKTTAIYTHISHNLISKIDSPLNKMKF